MLNGGVLGQPSRKLERARRLALDADLERLEPAQQQPRGIGRGDNPRRGAKRPQPRGVLIPGAADEPEQRVVVPGKDLRRAVKNEVGAVLEGSPAAAG